MEKEICVSIKKNKVFGLIKYLLKIFSYCL